jgi:hypothetical protein
MHTSFYLDRTLCARLVSSHRTLIINLFASRRFERSAVACDVQQAELLLIRCSRILGLTFPWKISVHVCALVKHLSARTQLILRFV